MKNRIIYGFHTEKGIREENQDSLLVMEDKQLFAVADGMGGGCFGSRVSRMAVEALEEEFSEGRNDTLDYCYHLLLKKMRQINSYVYNLSREKACTMGTTLSVVVFREEGILIGNVGDTWICRIRDNGLEILSRVHSVAGEQYERGLISYREYRNHALKYVLTQAIGTNDEINPCLKLEKYCPGDIYILCSDGVYNFIEEEEMVDRILEVGDNLEEACRKIVRKALEGGSNDNLSIMVIKVK